MRLLSDLCVKVVVCGRRGRPVLVPVQLAVWEWNLRPSDRYLPLPQQADVLHQSLLEQGVEVLQPS